MTEFRVPIVTDTHAGARGDSATIYNIQRQFWENVFWPAIDASPGVTDILHLGDLVDRRKYINYQTLRFAKETFFTPARDRGLKVHWVLGNHDLPYKNTLELSGYEAFKEYKNLVVYTDATVVNFGGTDVLLMPWLCDENRESSTKKLEAFDGTTVAGHFEFGGFEMYRGVPNYHGASTDPYNHFPLVMSGHYHHRSSRKNIHYLGSPYEMTWSDYGDKRGFHWWTPATASLSLVENPGRLFYKYIYDDTDAPVTYVRDLLARASEDNLIQKIVKVIVKKKNKPTWYEAYADAMLRLGAFDVQFVDDTAFTETDTVTESEATMDTLTMISWYVDGLPWPNPEIQTGVKTLLTDLYHEASERAKSVARN